MPRRYSLSTVTASTGQPVELEEIKLALRIDHSDEDAYLRGLSKAATTLVETWSHRALLTQTLRMALEDFAVSTDEDTATQYLPLPKPPLQSVSSITYVATDGTSTVWASSNYSVDTYTEPGRVSLVYGNTWPSVRLQPNAVQVQYVAGSTSTTGIDEGYKLAIKMLVDHWYHHRASVDSGNMAEVPLGVRTLLASLDPGSYTI